MLEETSIHTLNRNVLFSLVGLQLKHTRMGCQCQPWAFEELSNTFKTQFGDVESLWCVNLCEFVIGLLTSPEFTRASVHSVSVWKPGWKPGRSGLCVLA